jgi:hypothetical protein
MMKKKSLEIFRRKIYFKWRKFYLLSCKSTIRRFLLGLDDHTKKMVLKNTSFFLSNLQYHGNFATNFRNRDVFDEICFILVWITKPIDTNLDDILRLFLFSLWTLKPMLYSFAINLLQNCIKCISIYKKKTFNGQTNSDLCLQSVVKDIIRKSVNDAMHCNFESKTWKI